MSTSATSAPAVGTDWPGVLTASDRDPSVEFGHGLLDVRTKQSEYFLSARPAVVFYQPTDPFESSERRRSVVRADEFKAADPPLARSAGEGLRPRFTLLRWGFVAFLALVTLGLLLASFALATAAGPLLTGISLVTMWTGNAAVTIAAHVQGRRSGEYLLSQRGSWAAVVLVVGMALVAAIATVEFSLK